MKGIKNTNIHSYYTHSNWKKMNKKNKTKTTSATAIATTALREWDRGGERKWNKSSFFFSMISHIRKHKVLPDYWRTFFKRGINLGYTLPTRPTNYWRIDTVPRMEHICIFLLLLLFYFFIFFKLVLAELWLCGRFNRVSARNTASACIFVDSFIFVK